jgi:hypothetical protein
MSLHHSLLKRITQLGLVLMMGVSMSSCASNEYKTWQEEVKLNDGRVIVVTQKKRCSGAYTGGNYASCIAREAWLTIKLPELGNQEIVWHEHLSPVVLNIHLGQLYVVGEPPTGREFDFYGKPQPPYIGFVLEGTQWKRISFAEIPEAIYDLNMLIEAIPPSEVDYLTLVKKESITTAILNGNPPAIRMLNKRIDPKYKSNF